MARQCLSSMGWFHADMHYEEAHSWAMNWEGVREYHALDLFGYSQGLAWLVQGSFGQLPSPRTMGFIWF